MKKGVSHVDWAISMGLFLVFVMLTLIALRPGTEPIYKGDTLLKIIEEGLKEDAYYTVEKQLLNINSDFSCTTEKCKIRIREASKNGLSPGWVKDENERRYVAMINETQTKFDEETIVFDVRNDYCDEPLENEGDCDTATHKYYPGFGSDHVLDFYTFLKPGMNTLYLLHSDNFTYNTYQEEEVHIDMKDEPVDANDWCSKCRLDGYNFTYEFGVSETYRAFSEEKLTILESEVYENLRQRWDLPNDVQFMIDITNLSSYTVNYSFGNAEEPLEQTNVFVREWSGWVLQGESTLIPIKTRIKIWQGIRVTPITPPPPPPIIGIKLFSVENPSGETVASFDSEGNVELAGTCSSCDSPPPNSFIIKNLSGVVVAYIDSSGNLCLKTGDCNDYDTSCDTPPDGSFIVKDSSGNNVAYIGSDGELCLKGSLTEGSL